MLINLLASSSFEMSKKLLYIFSVFMFRPSTKVLPRKQTKSKVDIVFVFESTPLNRHVSQSVSQSVGPRRT